jgi:hypothetical protein
MFVYDHFAASLENPHAVSIPFDKENEQISTKQPVVPD